MKNSNILSAAFLGVFGTVCFIGGFFTGEYATYNEKVISDMYKQSSRDKNKMLDILNFGNSINRLQLLIELKNGSDLSERLNANKKILSRTTKDWENKLNSDEYKYYSRLIQIELKRARKLLHNGKSHNK